jgi:hypothetical protein
VFTPGKFSVLIYAQYFTSSVWVSCFFFSWTGRHVFFLRVNVTWTDFVSFAFIRHFFNRDWILFKCICSQCVAIAGYSCVVRMAVSFAKVAVVLSAVVGKSAV